MSGLFLVIIRYDRELISIRLSIALFAYSCNELRRIKLPTVCEDPRSPTSESETDKRIDEIERKSA